MHKAPAALERLQNAALSGDNIFAELMNTVRFCSLGQITQALYDVGGSIEGICNEVLGVRFNVRLMKQ